MKSFGLFLEPEKKLATVDAFFEKVPAREYRVNRLTVEVTKYCSVGCSFCKYNAPPERGAKKKSHFLGGEAIRMCLAFIAEHSVDEVIITGGGEPTHEMATVKTLLAGAAAGKFQIYTAGQWATSETEARSVLSDFQQALRANINPAAALNLRLSVDDFHQEKIGFAPIAHIIRAHAADKFSNITLELRTVVNHDFVIEQLATALGGKVARMSEFAYSLSLPQLDAIPIRRLNLIPMGRQRTKPEENSPTFFETLDKLQDNLGPDWPTKYAGGLNIGIRPSGKIFLYGASSDDFGRIPDRSIFDTISRIVQDPISIALISCGFRMFVTEIARCDRRLELLANSSREPSILIPEYCRVPEQKLLAKLVASTMIRNLIDGGVHFWHSLGLTDIAHCEADQQLEFIAKEWREQVTDNQQKIGHITKSRNVRITQSISGIGGQEIGDVSESEGVNVLQSNQGILKVDADSLLETMTQTSRTDLFAVRAEIQNYLVSVLGNPSIPVADLKATLDALKQVVEKPEAELLIDDAAVAITLVSGAVTIASVNDPILLYVAVPATLVTLGYLQREKLREVYAWIKAKLLKP